MNRIQQLFESCRQSGKKVFTAYLSMGCPDLEYSEKAAAALLGNGADMLECGMPFSDPMADGAIIREASRKSLASGTTLTGVLDSIAHLRQRFPQVPLILFSYYNVIFRYGVEKFAKAAAEAGVDAVLVVDMVLEEREELLTPLRNHNLTMVPLVAPTTPLSRVADIARGLEDSFIYAITVKGVTGERSALPPDLAERLAAIRKISGMPVQAGFGISTPAQAAAVGAAADGFIIGSAIVHQILTHPDEQGLASLAQYAASFR